MKANLAGNPLAENWRGKTKELLASSHFKTRGNVVPASLSRYPVLSVVSRWRHPGGFIQFFSPLTVVMLAINPLIQMPAMAIFLRWSPRLAGAPRKG